MAIEKGLYAAPEGLEDSITDMEEMEVPDMEIEIVDPESVTLSDGSMEITIIPGAEADFSEFGANLAELLEDDVLETLSSDLVGQINTDIEARKDWADTFVKGLDVLGFKYEETTAYNIILLNSIKQRIEFPELKQLAMEEYNDWEPDAFIVEKKSSGVALYQEMRRMGLPVSEYTPHRGSGDKLARLNSVADIVASGLCWVPQTRWAEEVVEEIAGFPFMSNDDLVDSTVMALMRFRQGGFIRLPSDEPEDQQYFKQRRGGYY